MPYAVTPYPKSDTEPSTKIPHLEEKYHIENLTPLPPSIKPDEKPVLTIKTPSTPIEQPIAKSEPVHPKVQPKASKLYFTVGSTNDEVLAAQGTPTSFSDQYWRYGLSSVQFRDGRVVSWNSSQSNPLNVRMLPAQRTSNEYFTVGSTKDEVLAAQGTPTSFSDQYWRYGLSSVQFRDGRVVSWNSSRSNPLKVLLLPSKSQ
jgi:outer membrane protein assembly factor BamE (lipoprotein component of BamABCDE complex)